MMWKKENLEVFNDFTGAFVEIIKHTNKTNVAIKETLTTLGWNTIKRFGDIIVIFEPNLRIKINGENYVLIGDHFVIPIIMTRYTHIEVLVNKPTDIYNIFLSNETREKLLQIKYIHWTSNLFIINGVISSRDINGFTNDPFLKNIGLYNQTFKLTDVTSKI